MFSECCNLTELNISSFNTSSVGSFGYMFSGLQHLATLDLRSFNMSSANDYSSMFYDISGLTDVYLPEKFFSGRCYSWDGNWNTVSGAIVDGALSDIGVIEMHTNTAQGSTCTFHCRNEKDVKMLNAIKDRCSNYGTLNFEQCTDQP